MRSLMPNARKVVENFFKTLSIQEPAFKDVVVLYRRRVPDQPVRKSEYDPIRPHDPVRIIACLVTDSNLSEVLNSVGSIVQ